MIRHKKLGNTVICIIICILALIGCAHKDSLQNNDLLTNECAQQEKPILDESRTNWNIEDGVLRIECEAKMDRWNRLKVTSNGNTRYPEGVEDFHTLIIDGQVRNIPDSSFACCIGLKTVILADGVQSIGEDAFRDCPMLTKVVIPQSVNEIGSGSFSYCSQLTSITLPNRLKTVRHGLFEGCSSLIEITIPASVKEMEEFAIEGPGCKRIIFEGTVESILALYLDELPDMEQLVFLDGPPVSYGIPADFPEYSGLTFGGVDELPTVYYLKKNLMLWSPMGESDWNGCPLVGIDSLMELPSIR